MVYSFQLVRHANIRYREAVSRLGRCELLYMLRTFLPECQVSVEQIGGADFLTFECRELSPGELQFLSAHSGLVFFSAKEGELLRPLETMVESYLPEELPEVLKYKGKTSASFTGMMINTALSLTPYAPGDGSIRILDPMCGKGTTLFCALMRGFHACGIDTDRKAVKEGADYFKRYLRIHLLKHTAVMKNETAGKTGVPCESFTFADTKEHFQAGDVRTAKFYCGDTALCGSLFRKKPFHLLVADIPYGIQHAPQSGHAPESFTALLKRAAPQWREALLPGGAAAISFNTLTLSRDKLNSILEDSGFSVCTDDELLHLRHEVEQAVVRDVIFAIRK